MPGFNPRPLPPPRLSRAALRKKGFDVDLKGPTSARLQAAIRAARAGRDPHKWNLNNPRAGQSVIRDAKGNAVGLSDSRGAGSRRGGNAVADAGGGGGTGSRSMGRGPVVRPKTRPAGGGGGGNRGGGGGGGRRRSGGGGGGVVSANTGSMFSRSLADDGAQLLGNQYADSLAGAQYDDAIHQLNTQQSRLGQQGTQNLQNIHDWYGQVQSALDTARTRNNEDATGAAGADEALTRGLIESLGGGANQGSGLVAAAGSDQAAMQRALGQSHSQYESDMAPLLQAEAAQQGTNEQNRQRAAMADVANQLYDAQRGRGQAKSNAIYDITKYNNDIRDNRVNRLMQIMQANNALSQTRFGNAMGIESARQAAALTGAKIQDMLGGGATKNNWANMTPGDRASIAHDAAASVMGVDADGNPTGHIRSDLTVPQIVKMVADQYRMAGFKPARNPAVRQNVFAVLRSLGLQPGKSWLRAPKKKRR